MNTTSLRVLEWSNAHQTSVNCITTCAGLIASDRLPNPVPETLIQVGKDDFGGVGATVVDSLDTLWLMGLKDEFKAARDWTAQNLSFHT